MYKNGCNNKAAVAHNTIDVAKTIIRFMLQRDGSFVIFLREGLYYFRTSSANPLLLT